MRPTRSTFIVPAEEAVSIEIAAKELGYTTRHLQRQDTRNRLGLKLVRNRISLDDRRVWISKDSLLSAIAGLRGHHD